MNNKEKLIETLQDILFAECRDRLEEVFDYESNRSEVLTEVIMDDISNVLLDFDYWLEENKLVESIRGGKVEDLDEFIYELSERATQIAKPIEEVI
jgi:L-lactate utilization protein LutB